MHIFKYVGLGVLLSCGILLSAPPQRLIVIGGGEHPKDAMTQFWKWGQEKDANFVFISWASEGSVAGFEYFKADFNGLSVKSIVHAPKVTDGGKKDLLKMLETATGVFFGGGDQNLIMQQLD